MSPTRPMFFRLLLLLGVAVVLWVGAVPLIPQDTTFRPPSGPPAMPLGLPPLPEPEATMSPNVYWEQKAALQVGLYQVRRSLEGTFARAFFDEAGPGSPFNLIVLATEDRDIPGATVIKVPHSRNELEHLRDWILDRIGDHNPPIRADAWISYVDNGIVVLVCAPPDAKLNLAFIPATAAVYTGECRRIQDPSSEL